MRKCKVCQGEVEGTKQYCAACYKLTKREKNRKWAEAHRGYNRQAAKEAYLRSKGGNPKAFVDAFGFTVVHDPGEAPLIPGLRMIRREVDLCLERGVFYPGTILKDNSGVYLVEGEIDSQQKLVVCNS